jgi:hypothetical protein
MLLPVAVSCHALAVLYGRPTALALHRPPLSTLSATHLMPSPLVHLCLYLTYLTVCTCVFGFGNHQGWVEPNPCFMDGSNHLLFG